jgi:hypothetical protein
MSLIMRYEMQYGRTSVLEFRGTHVIIFPTGELIKRVLMIYSSNIRVH